jgi:alpha-galactosidase
MRIIVSMPKYQRVLAALFVIAIINSAFWVIKTPNNVLAQDNGLALVPPMGWNSWNKFRCNVSEQLIKDTADAMSSNGMKSAGYQYIIIDDCWQISRDSQSNIIPDPTRFPSGMKSLADYVHSKGLKFGLYSDRGTKTCEGRPGSHGYETQDANTYASWGVDYLKYDNCYADGDQQADYERMRDALQNSGRDIVFSICAWEFIDWMPKTGNLWRTTRDIQDTWNSIMSNIDINKGLAAYAGPGAWNDPDMLEIGNGGMTETEYKTHFSMWAIMAAPLIAGNDMRSMDTVTKAILTNQEIISVDQDPLGIQGSVVRDDGLLEVWSKSLSEPGTKAVVLLNRGSAEADITVNWSEIGLTGNASVRDLWLHKDLGQHAGSFKARVAAHGTVMLKITSVPAVILYLPLMISN